MCGSNIKDEVSPLIAANSGGIKTPRKDSEKKIDMKSTPNDKKVESNFSVKAHEKVISSPKIASISQTPTKVEIKPEKVQSPVAPPKPRYTVRYKGELIEITVDTEIPKLPEKEKLKYPSNRQHLDQINELDRE